MSSRVVEKLMKKLKEARIHKRNGADFDGYFEIVIMDKPKSVIIKFRFLFVLK